MNGLNQLLLSSSLHLLTANLGRSPLQPHYPATTRTDSRPALEIYFYTRYCGAWTLLYFALGRPDGHRSKNMTRLLHKPRIFQQDRSPRKSTSRQLRRKLQAGPHLCSTSPITAAMPNRGNEVEGEIPGRKRISLAVSEPQWQCQAFRAEPDSKTSVPTL